MKNEKILALMFILIVLGGLYFAWDDLSGFDPILSKLVSLVVGMIVSGTLWIILASLVYAITILFSKNKSNE